MKNLLIAFVIFMTVSLITVWVANNLNLERSPFDDYMNRVETSEASD